MSHFKCCFGPWSQCLSVLTAFNSSVTCVGAVNLGVSYPYFRSPAVLGLSFAHICIVPFSVGPSFVGPIIPLRECIPLLS